MGKQAVKPARYVIDEEQLRMICKTASEAGVQAYIDEHKNAEKERQNRVLNSAKTLIMNYRRFKKMCENSVYDKDTTNEISLKEVMELMSGQFRNTDFEVLSITEKVVRTRMIMDHVDTMLKVYEQQCNASPDPEEARRFRIIKALYLDTTPVKAKDVAEKECITISTVYRDCDKAFRKLAILFFGIDGVRF